MVRDNKGYKRFSHYCFYEMDIYIICMLADAYCIGRCL